MAKDTSEKKARKDIPRTFDRRPKPWLRAITDLPKPTSETLLTLRRDVLNLSRADAAKVLRVARNTVWDWETDYRRAPFSAFLALRLLANEMRQHLSGDPWRNRPFDVPANVPAAPAEPRPPGYLWKRFRTRRERAAQLRVRMSSFTTIYNAGWLVRDAQSSHEDRRQDLAWRFIAVLQNELRDCHDPEALIYAIADTIACSPHGLPWEG